MTEQTWPSLLWLVRHGESAGNVARDAAEALGLPVIEIAGRDVDVPLSALGERQARALGRWFGDMPQGEQPTVVLTSPYARAMQTAAGIVETAGLAGRPLVNVIDERLREKEFGSLDRLTRAGILARFPEEAARRAQVGKFYYRPPGGESWCDVILRLRSVLHQIQLRYNHERVLLVAHQVVVLCFRYLLEEMSEEQLLAVDRERDIPNCSVTAYGFACDTDGREAIRLQLKNFVAPITDAGETVTAGDDTPAGSR